MECCARYERGEGCEPLGEQWGEPSSAHKPTGEGGPRPPSVTSHAGGGGAPTLRLEKCQEQEQGGDSAPRPWADMAASE